MLTGAKGTIGSVVNEASLLAALSEHGAVFHLNMTASYAFATFKSTDVVKALVDKGSLSVNSAVIQVKPLVYNTALVPAPAASACSRAAALCQRARHAWRAASARPLRRCVRVLPARAVPPAHRCQPLSALAPRRRAGRARRSTRRTRPSWPRSSRSRR